MTTKLDIWKSLLVIVVGLLVLYFVFDSIYLLYAALTVGVLSVLFPSLGRLIFRTWMAIGQFLGRINGSILLSIVFFMLLFPISILYRLFNKDAMQLKNTKTSLFIDRDHIYKKEDMENVW